MIKAPLTNETFKCPLKHLMGFHLEQFQAVLSLDEHSDAVTLTGQTDADQTGTQTSVHQLYLRLLQMKASL